MRAKKVYVYPKPYSWKDSFIVSGIKRTPTGTNAFGYLEFYTNKKSYWKDHSDINVPPLVFRVKKESDK
jgi:hypothetical protein